MKFLTKNRCLGLLSLILLLLNSCSDSQEVLPEKDIGVQFESNRLQFTTEQAFEDFLLSGESPQKDLNNGRTSFAENAIDINQDVPKGLLSILNEDQVFQVKSWVFRLNFEERRVYVIDKEDEDLLYAELINENDSKDGVFSFSMDYDVFQLLNDGYREDPEHIKVANNGRESFILCGGGTSKGSTSSGKIDAGRRQVPIGHFPSPNYVDVMLRIEAISQYKKFGIWFEFSSVGRVYETAKTGLTYTLNYDIEWKRQQNCTVGNEREGTNVGSGSAYYDPTTPNYLRYKVTVYKSTRGLKKLRMDSKWTLDSTTATAPLFNRGY